MQVPGPGTESEPRSQPTQVTGAAMPDPLRPAEDGICGCHRDSTGSWTCRTTGGSPRAYFYGARQLTNKWMSHPMELYTQPQKEKGRAANKANFLKDEVKYNEIYLT